MISDDIVATARATKLALCTLHPMCDIASSVYLITYSGTHHVYVLDDDTIAKVEAGTFDLCADIGGRVELDTVAVAGVIAEGYVRPVGVAASEPYWGLQDAYENDPASLATPAVVVSTITPQGVERTVTIPYRWDDYGRPSFGEPIIHASVVPSVLVGVMLALVRPL